MNASLELPPGYTVERDVLVGYNFKDEMGNIVFQHPNDGESARLFVWQIYKKRQGK